VILLLGCWTTIEAAGSVTVVPGANNPRRAPDPDDRQRDAERTRQRILDAALAEFAAKGTAGARVRSIAERAGVNTQLISYYFGGKQGLYQEVVRRWHQREDTIGAEQLSLADLVTAYLDAGFDQPEFMRIFVWEGLTGGAFPDEWPEADGEDPEVTAFRARQAAGELADDLDPAYVLVFLMGAVLTPVAMPQTIERICGVAADSEEFRTQFGQQLRLIAAHLAGPRRDGADKDHDRTGDPLGPASRGTA
jgi:AcrR family transcriptional regulator